MYGEGRVVSAASLHLVSRRLGVPRAAPVPRLVKSQITLHVTFGQTLRNVAAYIDARGRVATRVRFTGRHVRVRAPISATDRRRRAYTRARFFLPPPFFCFQAAVFAFSRFLAVKWNSLKIRRVKIQPDSENTAAPGRKSETFHTSVGVDDLLIVCDE